MSDAFPFTVNVPEGTKLKNGRDIGGRWLARFDGSLAYIQRAVGESHEQVILRATLVARWLGFDRPDTEQLQEWVYDSVAEALDGCTVEPDGVCEHGAPSWLLAIGVI
jgi:hypothetical protein